MERTNYSGVLKFFGVIMILFSIVYAIVGSMALAGVLEGLLPGHENQEILLVVLAYVVAVFGLVCGIGCLKGASGLCQVMGLLCAIVGVVSLIYAQITQDSFNIFDCIAAVLGAAIFFAARQKK